ncbi:hypothetical protein [Lacticaseibacillus saniviri]
MAKQKLLTLEQKFVEYQDVKTDIARREFEIKYAWQPTVEQVGGRSSTISKPQEKLYEAYEADRRWNYLQQLKADCERAIARYDAEQVEMYKLRFGKYGYHDWDEIGEILHHSHSTIYRKRYAMLMVLAEESGMI